MKLLNSDATMYLALRDGTSDLMAEALATAIEIGSEKAVFVVDQPHPLYNLLPKPSFKVQ